VPDETFEMSASQSAPTEKFCISKTAKKLPIIRTDFIEGKVIPVLKHYAMKAYGGVDV
jgi:hypothetical protein